MGQEREREREREREMGVCVWGGGGGGGGGGGEGEEGEGGVGGGGGGGGGGSHVCHKSVVCGAAAVFRWLYQWKITHGCFSAKGPAPPSLWWCRR